MKIEISYKNSLIGSLQAGESLALHLNGSKLIEDLIVRAVGDAVIPEVTKLSAPTISIDGSTLTITDTSGAATNFNIYSNGVCITGTADASTSFDLSSLITESGTYSITVTAFADGYEESEPSNAVEYVVEESVPTDLTGYTVTVPAGWSASAGFGMFDVSGTVNYYDFPYAFSSFYVGYAINFDDGSLVNSSNAVVFYGFFETYPNGNSLSFTVSGGSDSSNSSLIQWLVDNNATFTPPHGGGSNE